MEKIAVAFECPNCHMKKNVRKLHDTPMAKIKCPGCGAELKLTFDVNAEPQTVVVELLQQADIKQPEAPQQQVDKKKNTVYQSMPQTPQVANQVATPPVYKPRVNPQLNGTAPRKGATQLLSHAATYELRHPVFVCRIGGRLNNKVVERYSIGKGAITIGRLDPINVSDIMFDKDPEMSRRSVELSVIPTEFSTVLKLKVLKATNPVTVGFHTLVEGETVALKFNEVFKIGSTNILVTDNPNLKKI